MGFRETYLAFGKPNFSDQEVEAVSRVIRSGWVGMGPETIAFEEELAVYLGVPHVVTVNSCTSALFLSLVVHGIKPGDEVICPSLTWCSTANAALYLGARPIFCEVDPKTFCAATSDVIAKLTPRTKAVIVVHLGGAAADIRELRDALPAHIAIVEDAAHALPARYRDGRRVGASGNLACFSFYANKNLSTGEGGAIALFDDDTRNRLRSLRLHALPLDAWKRFSNPKSLMLSPLISELGYKMNFTDLQAALGRVQLKRLGEMQEARLAVANHYMACLSEKIPDLQFQAAVTSDSHARHLFLVVLPIERLRKSRDQIILELRARNIGASIHYAPLHLMPLYQEGIANQLPITEDLCKRVVTLPISASMTVDDADYVATHLGELLN